MLAFWNWSNKSAGTWMWLNFMLLFWMAFVHSLSHGKNLGPVVRKVDNAIHRINLYPLDNAIDFPNTYPPDSDISRWIAPSNVSTRHDIFCRQTFEVWQPLKQTDTPKVSCMYVFDQRVALIFHFSQLSVIFLACSAGVFWVGETLFVLVILL